MHLSVLLGHGPAPHTIGQWKLDRSWRGWTYSDPAYWEHLARTLERGRFDMLFLADGYDLHDRYRDTPDIAVKYALQYPKHDVLPLIPIMARVTSHLGFGATLSTTYLPPYYVARSFATLDHLTRGRIGWNVVTSYGHNEAANFGLDSPLSHDERYDRAEEFMELCYQLWDSWGEDAVLFDRDSGEFADPGKVHRVDHDGPFFRCQGPLQVTRSPQGRPVILQAGASTKGLAFAARHAEAVFTVRRTHDAMRSHRDALDRALLAAGRAPGSAKVLWGVLPIVAETERAARAKLERLVDDVPVEAGLAMMSGHFNVDLASYPPDEPVRLVGVDGVQGMAALVSEDFADDVTLAEVAKHYGAGIGAPPVVGNPEQVADQLEAMYEAGRGDGFMLITSALPGSVEDFVDLVVPVLQHRGLLRREYSGDTLREHLTSDGCR